MRFVESYCHVDLPSPSPHPLARAYVHLVEERNHLDDDNDAHDELNDAGDEEQHTRLCERGVSEGIGVYVSTACGGGEGGRLV